VYSTCLLRTLSWKWKIYYKTTTQHCQLLKINAAICWYLKTYVFQVWERLCYVRQISSTQDLRFLCRCWRGFPCSGIWPRRGRHIRAVGCTCPQSSRRNVTNLRMEVVTSSETFEQFDRVLTDVTYRNVCVVACVTTARTAAAIKTTTITCNSYLLCKRHISHNPFHHRIPFNVSFMRSELYVHRLSSQIIPVLVTEQLEAKFFSIYTYLLTP
jgi:hypothetical protein